MVRPLAAVDRLGARAAREPVAPVRRRVVGAAAVGPALAPVAQQHVAAAAVGHVVVPRRVDLLGLVGALDRVVVLGAEDDDRRLGGPAHDDGGRAGRGARVAHRLGEAVRRGLAGAERVEARALVAQRAGRGVEAQPADRAGGVHRDGPAGVACVHVPVVAEQKGGEVPDQGVLVRGEGVVPRRGRVADAEHAEDHRGALPAPWASRTVRVRYSVAL